MGKFILKLCFLPFLIPIWIIRGCLNLLGIVVIGSAIDSVLFGRR